MRQFIKNNMENEKEKQKQQQQQKKSPHIYKITELNGKIGRLDGINARFIMFVII